MNAKRAGRISAPATDLLPSIQWLRAIAALMVVIHHINFHTDWLREQAGARLGRGLHGDCRHRAGDA